MMGDVDGAAAEIAKALAEQKKRREAQPPIELLNRLANPEKPKHWRVLEGGKPKAKSKAKEPLDEALLDEILGEQESKEDEEAKAKTEKAEEPVDRMAN
jgi:hypothetical protein